jgi:hypothetical protein
MRVFTPLYGAGFGALDLPRKLIIAIHNPHPSGSKTE